MGRDRQQRNSGAVGVRFLRPEQVNEALDELAAASEDQRVRMALAGGVAMQLYGSDRFTKDVDVIAEKRISGFKKTGDLSFGGVMVRTAADTPVDIILRDDEYQPLYEAALNAPRKVRGVPLLVVSPEYLAAIKLAAARGKDMDDLEFLVLSASADLKKTRRIVVKYLGLYAGREFDSFVQEVQVLGHRAR